MDIGNSTTEFAIQEIFRKIATLGPLIINPLKTRYTDTIINHGIPDTAISDIYKSNRVVSCVSLCVANEESANRIYNICMRNDRAFRSLCKYIDTEIMGNIDEDEIDDPLYMNDFELLERERTQELAKKIFPSILKHECTKENDRRDIYLQNFGPGVPTVQALQKLQHFVGSDTVLNINAGTGLWAGLMALHGISVTATDINPANGWFDIEQLSTVSSLLMYQHNVLFMVWPSDSTFTEALESFTGNKLVYIGECAGGYTMDDAFFRVLDDNYQLVNVVELPNWPGLSDKMYMFQKKYR